MWTGSGFAAFASFVAVAGSADSILASSRRVRSPSSPSSLAGDCQCDGTGFNAPSLVGVGAPPRSRSCMGAYDGYVNLGGIPASQVAAAASRQASRSVICSRR